jgi:hypothetical protein
MTGPAFTVDSVHQDAPFRLRSCFAGYHQFADRSGAVLVAPEISTRLWEAARIARPFETGGLLAGRVFCDGKGRYVILVGCVEAPPNARRLAQFELSPEATDQLRKGASRTHPAADVVGWWHSHDGPSEYSQTDLSQQSVWTQPESVGILVFAEGQRWGIVHQGPDARPLNGPPDVLPRPADQLLTSDVKTQDGASGGPAALNPIGTLKTAGQRPTAFPLRGILAGFVLVALLAMVGSGIVLGQIASVQRRLPAQIGQILRAGPRRMWLGWSCTSQGLAARTFVCVADVSNPSDGVEWQLDGRTVSRSQVAVISLPSSNVDGCQIQVLVRDHGQIYYGGSEIIY